MIGATVSRATWNRDFSSRAGSGEASIHSLASAIVFIWSAHQRSQIQEFLREFLCSTYLKVSKVRISPQGCS